MPEKILGLDIGGSSVKAVLLSRGFRGGCCVVGVRRIELAAADGLAEALRELFADSSFRGFSCVTALPAGMLSFRNLRLPFRDVFHQQAAERIRPDVRQLRHGRFHQRHALGQREQGMLALVFRDGDDDTVKQLRRPLDDVQMAVGERIKTAGINRGAHFSF